MAYLLVGKRAKEIAAVAARNNLEYLERDPSGLSRHGLSIFSQSDHHVAENLLVGRMRGHEVYGFDYPYLASGGDHRSQLPAGFPTMHYENGNQYGCVVVPFEADFPMVHIAKRGRGSHLSGMETPVNVSNKGFSKLFSVWSEDPVFLHRFLTDEIVELLVTTKGRFTFELYRNLFLCLNYRVQPDEFPPLMSLAVAVVERIPGNLGDEFPPVNYPDSEFTPDAVAPTGFAALVLSSPPTTGDHNETPESLTRAVTSAGDGTEDHTEPLPDADSTWF